MDRERQKADDRIFDDRLPISTLRKYQIEFKRNVLWITQNLSIERLKDAGIQVPQRNPVSQRIDSNFTWRSARNRVSTPIDDRTPEHLLKDKFSGQDARITKLNLRRSLMRCNHRRDEQF